MQTPLDRYNSELCSKRLYPDPAQQQAIMRIQNLFDELVAQSNTGPRLFNTIKSLVRIKSQRKITGLYLWGGVGRGKTFLVDTFYDCLPFKNKLRIHFYRLMQNLHKELKELKASGNVTNPLKRIAKRLAKQTRILCFDEFHVSDITDAMLLAGLLEYLCEHGVVLVITSNQHPDTLYQDGLQRQRFLPTIALLKKYTEIIRIDSGIDYRLQFFDHAEIYHCPLDKQADEMLENDFNRINPTIGGRNTCLEIQGRMIQTIRCGDGVVWFDFKTLCHSPRGPADYIDIARQFQTVLLSNIPILDDTNHNTVKRFITLIDEFYDRNVKLIITAEAEPAQLYIGSYLTGEFGRTLSRLEEMRTHDYLAKQHLP